MNNSKYTNRGCRLPPSTDSRNRENNSATGPPGTERPPECGLVSYTVQSFCTLLDHEGHRKVIETLTEEKLSLEEQLHNLKALRVQWAAPEYFYDTVKHAQQAKHREEERCQTLRAEMSCLKEELAENVLLPIALEGQIKELRAELEKVSQGFEAEKTMRQEAVLREKACLSRLDAAGKVVLNQQKQLQACGRKLGRSATVVDQLSEANFEAREAKRCMEQEVDMAKATAADAEMRMSLAHEEAAAYRAVVEKEFALLKAKHDVVIASLEKKVKTSDANLNKMMVAKDEEIQALSRSVTEVKGEVLEMKAKMRQCNAAARAKFQSVLHDVVVRDERIRTLRLAVKDAYKSSSNELKDAVDKKDEEIQRLSEMVTLGNQHASSLERSANEAMGSKIAAEFKIKELSTILQNRDEQIENLRRALTPKALGEQTSHKLQSYMLSLQRELLDRDRCINDLHRVIRVIRGPPAATSPIANDELVSLKIANAQLKEEVSNANASCSKANATIEDMSSRSQEIEGTQAELILENQTLKADLQVKVVQLSNLSHKLETLESENLELEKQSNELDSRNTTLISGREQLEKRVRDQESLTNGLGCKLFSTARAGIKLRSQLEDAKDFGNLVEQRLKKLEEWNTRLASERTSLMEQLATAHAEVDNLKELNFAQDGQNRSLRMEVFTGDARLQEVKAKAEWTVSMFEAQVEGLKESKMCLLDRVSILERDKEREIQTIGRLRGRAEAAESKLEATEVRCVESTAISKKLQDTILEKDMRITNLSNQLGALQKETHTPANPIIRSAESGRNQAEIVPIEGSQKMAGMGVHPARINFSQTRSLFEQGHNVSNARNVSTIISSPFPTVVPAIIDRLEHNTIRVPLNGRAKGMNTMSPILSTKRLDELTEVSPNVQTEDKVDENKIVDGIEAKMVYNMDKSDAEGSDVNLSIGASDSTEEESLVESAKGEQEEQNVRIEIRDAESDEDSGEYDMIGVQEAQAGLSSRSQSSSMSSSAANFGKKSGKKRGFLKRLKTGLKKGLKKRL